MTVLASIYALLVFIPEAIRDRRDGIKPLERVARSEAPGHVRRARDVQR